ncbi:Nucleolar pre-ribosomal-associated protein 2 [Madurella mycetomatis]|uniref:Nucleolar pre-ribosomal-associated protein 2 n=1 Tax=Madurella mycetomatis TaxID=100816 RepID=A0A175VUN0_9PEZI|nr:Nucleolar pre-ribosomal-associated protein 2 [Madurella mycetomatis]
MGTDYAKASEAALVRAVRALDQGDAETIPDRLEGVWDTLSGYRGGNFHAAEEMLLRWLLKNMAGSSTNAERVRRHPRAWDILGAVFALIPLFSLAKSLADRRFVGILQQTLKDIATPQQQEGGETKETDPDVEMADAPFRENPANPRKRKRAGSSSFDISAQRRVAGCLQSAEAVFEAVRILLSRCETKALEGPTTHRMGAEHVKSLFSSPAAEAMGILVPWLVMCGVAMDRPQVEPFREQSSWLSTFITLWELHLQSASDSSEVATHLSGTGARLLGKLTGIPQQTRLGIDPAVQDRWARDLRRFLTRNLILPARAAFLTRGSREAVQIAVDMSSASAHTAFPVLFDLVSRSPLELGGKTSRKDYETWVQTVFDAILHASNNVNRDSRVTAVRTLMEMAAERGTVLSTVSLRSVCKSYALRPDAGDWSLLLSLVKLNPDVFLLSEDGGELLEQVLERTRKPDALSAEDFGRAAQFIVLLADGYAQARSLSTFIKTWLKYLAHDKPEAGLQPLWAQKELVDAVANLIQSSLNTNQLIDILEWLTVQTKPTESTARIYILEAISAGISQEEFIDAANMKIFDACRWTVASKAIARGTLEETGKIWSRIKSDIKSILRKSPVGREDTFAAFRCCVAAWLANHPGALHEDEAAKLICSFIDRLEKDGETIHLGSNDSESSVGRATYMSWILSDAPRLVSLYVERKNGIPNGIHSLVTSASAEDASLDSALAVSRLLLERESNINNQKLMGLLIDAVISQINTSKAGRQRSSTKVAIQFLLDVPTEVLSRTQREAAMKSLVSHLPGDSDKPVNIAPEYWKPALSLMIKLMEKPTFYEDMSFAHLESIGRCLWKTHHRSQRRSRGELASGDVAGDRDNFQLLQQLAMLVIRQMATGSIEEREKAFLTATVLALQSPCKDSDIVPRIVLLKAFVMAVQASSALNKLEGTVLDLGDIKQHLLQIGASVVKSETRQDTGKLSTVIALEALGCLDREAVRQVLSDAVTSLLEESDALVGKGAQVGWDIRMFLAHHFPEAIPSPLNAKMLVEASVSSGEAEKPLSGSPAATTGRTTLLQYVDTVVGAANEDTKLRYLEELLEDLNSQEALGRLVVICRLVHHLKGKRPCSSSRPSDFPSQFDLAKAHSALCHALQQTTAPHHFVLTAKIIHQLLDRNPAYVTQWNIELTLSSVAAISAVQASSNTLISTSTSTYMSLCRLVEIVIKRHRKRLDGHFHILITALQALLRLLLSRPSVAGATTTATTISSEAEAARHQSLWEKHARLFSRLLTLVCEPTVASVSRSQTSGLDSEKDRAKRYAGQFMYLVVMQYVKLQLEHVVPHGVREALEPGVYSVMDITTPDGLKIMNDAIDPSGRVIFKEMYKQYQKFGKWTGV